MGKTDMNLEEVGIALPVHALMFLALAVMCVLAACRSTSVPAEHPATVMPTKAPVLDPETNRFPFRIPVEGIHEWRHSIREGEGAANYYFTKSGYAKKHILVSLYKRQPAHPDFLNMPIAIQEQIIANMESVYLNDPDTRIVSREHNALIPDRFMTARAINTKYAGTEIKMVMRMKLYENAMLTILCSSSSIDPESDRDLSTALNEIILLQD